ncbi:MAG: Gfo/Idh/MocA family oxidoreductase [Kiritimatiellia bacterium]
MEPVKLGIIGCGVIAQKHLQAAADMPQAEIAAVADVRADRAETAARKFGAVSWYDSAEKLLEDPAVEAVILALPTGVRTPLVYETLRLGKHALIEKPIASSADEVEKILKLRGDRVAACSSSRMAFLPHAAAAEECAASGVLGDLRVVRIRAIEPAGPDPSNPPPPWRESMAQNGGGILVNWSCYDLDYLMHVTHWQLKPREVLAQWWPVGGKMTAYAAPGSDADSHYIALIRCEGGIALSMERAEFSSASLDRAWEITGTDSTLHMPMRPQEGRPNAVVLDRFVPGEGVISEVIWEEGQGNAEGNVTTDFVNAILNGTSPKTSLEKALLLQKITDGIYASADTGKSVAIS